jgi:hypothetical protein
MSPSPQQPEQPKQAQNDKTKDQQINVTEAISRHRKHVLALRTTDVREAPTIGEIVLPYLFAAMETCWIDAVFIGLASLDLFQSRDPLMPLWTPFLLIIGSQWLLSMMERRGATAGDDNIGSAGDTDEDGTGGKTTSSGPALSVLFMAIVTLFIIWLSVYAGTAILVDPRWLLAMINDVLLLDGNAYHVFVIVGFALYFCWRGIRLLTREYEPSQIFNTLRLGMGVIIAVILLRAGQESAGVILHDDLTLLLLVPIFLFLSLAAHSLARVTFMRHTHPVGLDGDASTQERFILTITGIIGGVLLLLSWLVETFASSSILVETQQFFNLLGAAYNVFVRGLAYVLVFLATPFFWLFEWWTSRFPPQLPTIPRRGVRPLPPKLLHPAPPPQLIIEPFLRVIVPILILLVIVIVVRLLLRRRRRVQLVARKRREEVRESLWSWSLFWAQLKALLRFLFGRFLPRKAAEEQPLVETGDLPTEPTARSIREIYRLLLRRAASRGYPRKRDETPDEFKQRLHKHVPEGEPQLATVTQAYNATRYGGVVPDEAEVVRVRQEWNVLEQKWREVS